MTRGDVGKVADLRLELLDDLGATGAGEDLHSLRRATCSSLERRLVSGRHFTVVAEEDEQVVGVGSLEGFEGRTVEANLAKNRLTPACNQLCKFGV